MFEICPPALIYVAFSLTQIIIDTLKGLYNTSLVKFIVMVMITILLNALCQGGLGIVSWIIVFIPFVMMTVITSVLLYVFGLNASTGTFKKPKTETETDANTKKDSEKTQQNVFTKKNGDIVIYDPYYDEVNHPVYFDSPNLIIPAPQGLNQTSTPTPSPTSSPTHNQNKGLVETATSVTTIQRPSFSNMFNSSSPEFSWV